MTAKATVVEEAVVEEISEEEALKQLEEGFLEGPAGDGEDMLTDTSATQTVVTEPDKKEPETKEEPKTESAQGDPQSAQTSVSADQILEVLKGSTTIAEIQAGLTDLSNKAFGKIGGVERTLKEIKDALSQGDGDVDLTDEFKELEEQYEDAAPLIKKGVQAALKKARKSVTVGNSISLEEIETALMPKIESIATQRADQLFIGRTLDREHKGWREVVGQPDSQTEFRQWLDQKPEEEKKSILASWDADTLSGALTDFKKSKEKPATTATPKNEVKPPPKQISRLEEAVTPKSQVKPPAPSKKTDDEEFEEGFRSGPAGRVK